MVAFNFGSVLVMIAALSATSAAPVQKRIAQVITDATKDWEQACLAAGGGQACNPLSVAAFSALLAAPDACAQQNAADNMIDLAKQLKNNAEMIRLAQIYREQPRNAPDSLSVLYCQSAPRNIELQGLFQCQFSGVNLKAFTGNRPVGQPGTIPFGLSAPVNPAGSCPASKTPIPDGQQLNKIVANPNAGGNAGAGNATTKPTGAVTASIPPPTAAATSTPAAGGEKPFTVQNGLDAQALNERFKTLTANSRCTTGEQACVVESFAQCVDGRFVLSACAGGTSCFALPLVNSRGTSLTCTTTADAQARIATAIGADKETAVPQPTTQAPKPTATATVAPPPASPPTASNSAVPPAGGDKSFVVQNGLDAQALNEQFKTLSRNSACEAGQQACIEDGFAQCVGGRFVVSACAGGLSCFALPLVNSKGTSLACTTAADAQNRIATALGTGAGAAVPTTQAPRPTATATATRPPTPSPPAASNSAVPAAGGAKPFALQNGLDAQALNKKFATLTSNSACIAGDNACVNGGFAQCVGGKFVVTGCAGGLICAGLPLVNSKGTSIACTTQADAIARIAATGASASLTG